MTIPVDDDIKNIVLEQGTYDERRKRTGSLRYTWIEIAGYAIYSGQKNQEFFNRVLGWIDDLENRRRETDQDVEVVER